MEKIWYKIAIATGEQDIEIYANEVFDGIIVETKELDEETPSSRIYLSQDEMELLIIKMREMMEYVKQ